MIATSLMTRSACCAADAQHMLAAVMDMYGLTSKPDICADKDDTDKMLTRMMLTRMVLTRMVLTRMVQYRLA